MSKGNVSIKKASEITLSNKMREAVQNVLKPLEAWENIAEPESYLEKRAGMYVFGLEELLRKAIEVNDFDAVRTITLDLLKMTKTGRAKADVNVGGVSKLRDEVDFSKVNSEELLKLLGKKDD